MKKKTDNYFVSSLKIRKVVFKIKWGSRKQNNNTKKKKTFPHNEGRKKN